MQRKKKLFFLPMLVIATLVMVPLSINAAQLTIGTPTEFTLEYGNSSKEYSVSVMSSDIPLNIEVMATPNRNDVGYDFWVDINDQAKPLGSQRIDGIATGGTGAIQESISISTTPGTYHINVIVPEYTYAGINSDGEMDLMYEDLSIAVTLVINGSLVTQEVVAPVDNTADATIKGEILRDLNLYKGISDTDLGLDRTMTRAEALVIFLRLFGLEEEIAANVYEHPFTDVPAWAKNYVGYAYENGLIFGNEEALFGPDMQADAATYLTYLLRGLDYMDSQGYYTKDAPYNFAYEVGIIPANADLLDFRRADAIVIAWEVLHTSPRGYGDLLPLGLQLFGNAYYTDIPDSNTPLATHGQPTVIYGLQMGKYVCDISSIDGNEYPRTMKPSITFKPDFSMEVSWYDSDTKEYKYGNGRYSFEVLDEDIAAMFGADLGLKLIVDDGTELGMFVIDSTNPRITEFYVPNGTMFGATSAESRFYYVPR